MNKLLILIFGLTICLMTHAETIYFNSDVTTSKWEVTGSVERCEMSQTIKAYGTISFVRQAGNPISLRVHTWQDIRSGLSVNISANPPPWLHNQRSHDIASNIAMQGGTDIMELDPFLTSRILVELEKGMTVRMDYLFEPKSSDNVVVEASTVNFRSAYDEFQTCVNKLLPYDYESISYMSIYFDLESTELNKTAKETLKKIVSYVKAGAKLSKITITGFADRRGRYQFNLKLTKARSEAVKAFLTINGVKEEVVEIEDTSRRGGYTFNGKMSDAENRRVTVRLTR